MYFFDSKVEFFTNKLSEENQLKSYVEGYELDLSEGDFKAQVLFLISIDNLDLETASEFSDLLVDNFRIELLKLLQKDSYAAFESGLRKVNAFFDDYFKDNDLDDKPVINVGAMLLVGNSVLFTKRGSIDMYLVRAGQINQISDALTESNDSEFFSNVASGEFQINDHFVLSTDRILRYISFNDFLKYSKNPENFKSDLLEVLNPKLQKLTGILSCHVTTLNEVSDTNEAQKSEHKFSFSNLNFKNHSSKLFLIFITLLLIVLLISGLVLTFNKNLKTQEGLDVATEIQNIKNTIINAKSEVSNERAFYTLNLASDKIKNLESLNQKSKALNDLKDEIQEVMLTLDNVQLIEEPLEIFNIESFNPNENIKSIFLTKSDFFIASDKSLYQNLSSNESEKVLGFTQDYNPKVSTVSSDFESVLFLTQDLKLGELSRSGTKILNVNNQFSDSVVDMFSYGKRLYFLDNKEKNIFKLQRINNGYYSKSNYFEKSQDFLESATQIAVDGSVYAFSDKFQFNKYFKSEIDSNFVVSNQPYIQIESLNDVYTDFDHSFMYALDSKNSRIFRYYKDSDSNVLEYDKVYSFPLIANPNNFLVDFNSEVIYVSTSSHVYKFPIN